MNLQGSDYPGGRKPFLLEVVEIRDRLRADIAICERMLEIALTQDAEEKRLKAMLANITVEQPPGAPPQERMGPYLA